MKLNVVTVITAHTSRLAAVGRLMEQIPNEYRFHVCWDDGTLGEPGNTRAALRWAETQKASHVLILQDDALPVPGFLELAHAAIAERPGHVISYYLGTGRPIQAKAARLIDEANAKGSRWINLGRIYWGVAWSLPTPYLPDLNAWLARHDGPTDRAVGFWAQANNKPCTHTWPSLIDHADGASLIHPQTDMERKAWRLLDSNPLAMSLDERPAPLISHDYLTPDAPA